MWETSRTMVIRSFLPKNIRKVAVRTMVTSICSKFEYSKGKQKKKSYG